MISRIGDRQIVVPLSAGNDSRLVASVLKHLGAKNVKCYSYGTKGNFEAKIAKIIADKLGYEWKFVPLTHKSEKKFYASDEFKLYLDYSETFCSVPYFQGLSTIKYLKDLGRKSCNENIWEEDFMRKTWKSKVRLSYTLIKTIFFL